MPGLGLLQFGMGAWLLGDAIAGAVEDGVDGALAQGLTGSTKPTEGKGDTALVPLRGAAIGGAFFGPFGAVLGALVASGMELSKQHSAYNEVLKESLRLTDKLNTDKRNATNKNYTSDEGKQNLLKEALGDINKFEQRITDTEKSLNIDIPAAEKRRAALEEEIKKETAYVNLGPTFGPDSPRAAQRLAAAQKELEMVTTDINERKKRLAALKEIKDLYLPREIISKLLPSEMDENKKVLALEKITQYLQTGDEASKSRLAEEIRKEFGLDITELLKKQIVELEKIREQARISSELEERKLYKVIAKERGNVIGDLSTSLNNLIQQRYGTNDLNAIPPEKLAESIRTLLLSKGLIADDNSITGKAVREGLLKSVQSLLNIMEAAERKAGGLGKTVVEKRELTTNTFTKGSSAGKLFDLSTADNMGTMWKSFEQFQEIETQWQDKLKDFEKQLADAGITREKYGPQIDSMLGKAKDAFVLQDKASLDFINEQLKLIKPDLSVDDFSKAFAGFDERYKKAVTLRDVFIHTFSKQLDNILPKDLDIDIRKMIANQFESALEKAGAAAADPGTRQKIFNDILQTWKPFLDIEGARKELMDELEKVQPDANLRKQVVERVLANLQQSLAAGTLTPEMRQQIIQQAMQGSTTPPPGATPPSPPEKKGLLKNILEGAKGLLGIGVPPGMPGEPPGTPGVPPGMPLPPGVPPLPEKKPEVGKKPEPPKTPEPPKGEKQPTRTPPADKKTGTPPASPAPPKPFETTEAGIFDANFYRNVNTIEDAIWEYVPDLDFLKTHEIAIAAYKEYRELMKKGEPSANSLRDIIFKRLKASGFSPPMSPSKESPWGKISVDETGVDVTPTEGWDKDKSSETTRAYENLKDGLIGLGKYIPTKETIAEAFKDALDGSLYKILTSLFGLPAEDKEPKTKTTTTSISARDMPKEMNDMITAAEDWEKTGKMTAANPAGIADMVKSRFMQDIASVEVTGPINEATSHLDVIEENTRQMADETKQVKEEIRKLVAMMMMGSTQAAAPGNTSSNIKSASPPNYWSWALDMTMGPNMGSRRPNGIT
jgi:hypothetical protein